MRKNQDGYILVYVLVVILALSMFAVGLTSHALKNHNIQKNAVTYTQDKYAAEGMIEQFVAELSDAIDLSTEYENPQDEIDAILSGYESGDGDLVIRHEYVQFDEDEVSCVYTRVFNATANGDKVIVNADIKVCYSLTKTSEEKFIVTNIATEYLKYETTQRKEA